MNEYKIAGDHRTSLLKLDHIDNLFAKDSVTAWHYGFFTIIMACQECGQNKGALWRRIEGLGMYRWLIKLPPHPLGRVFTGQRLFCARGTKLIHILICRVRTHAPRPCLTYPALIVDEQMGCGAGLAGIFVLGHSDADVDFQDYVPRNG